MDRSQAIGLVVLATFLMAYFYFFAPETTERPAQPPAKQEQTKTPDTTSLNTDNRVQNDTEVIDSVRQQQLHKTFGAFVAGAEGENETFVLENNLVKVEFSNRGGIITKVTLKEYENYKYEPLVLFDENSSEINLNVNTASGPVDLANLYFTRSEDFAKKTDTAGISFALKLSNGQSISHTYYLPDGAYQLIQHNNYEALDEVATNDEIALVWNNNLKKLDTDIEYNRQFATLNSYDAYGDFEGLTSTSKEIEEITFSRPVKWVSFNQKFFTTGFIAHGQFTSGRLTSFVNPEDTLHVKNSSIALQLPLEYYEAGAPAYTYYFGPNKFSILKDVTEGFEKNLNLGWPVIRWINRYLILTTFNLLEEVIPNYGIIIIILVFIIRLILSPLTYRSHIQMAKTKVLKPELEALKAKHGGDMQKMQGEQMKLYQQVGVNPLSGCIPLLLQMPILFAMFQFIPHAIELRHEPFLWAKDLSMYDSFIDLPFEIWGLGSHISLFTVLMTLSTILITYSNSQMTASMQGPMKTVQYAMPVIFMFVLNKYPAGLTFYYFVSNLVSYGQLTLMKRFVDEDKIRKVLDENRKKNVNKKKSKFQLRLEEAMKASEEAKKKRRK